MAFKTIRIERDGGAFIVTLSRPGKRNAFNAEMKADVIAAVGEAGKDPSVRAVVFTGGPQIFSSGQDLNEALAAKTPAGIIEMLTSWHKVNACLEEMSKPVIAAIEGACITGAFTSPWKISPRPMYTRAGTGKSYRLVTPSNSTHSIEEGEKTWGYRP